MSLMARTEKNSELAARHDRRFNASDSIQRANHSTHLYLSDLFNMILNGYLDFLLMYIVGALLVHISALPKYLRFSQFNA